MITKRSTSDQTKERKVFRMENTKTRMARMKRSTLGEDALSPTFFGPPAGRLAKK